VPVWKYWTNGKFFASAAFRNPDRPAHSLFTIPTTLPHLLYMLYMNRNNVHYLYTADCCIAVPFLYNCCTDISFAFLSTDGSAHDSALKFYDIDVNRFFFWESFGLAFHLTCKLRLNTCSHRDHKACFFVVRSSAKLHSVA